MLRQQINEALKTAMKAKEEVAVGTLRLILATLKDREIANRAKGNMEELGDGEILGVLQSMIKQRNESIAAFQQGGRADLVDQENKEIAVILRFLPKQMSDAEMTKAVVQLIDELGATSLKDMGRVMASLRETHPGRMDFSKASALVKTRLGG